MWERLWIKSCFSNVITDRDGQEPRAIPACDVYTIIAVRLEYFVIL